MEGWMEVMDEWGGLGMWIGRPTDRQYYEKSHTNIMRRLIYHSYIIYLISLISVSVTQLIHVCKESHWELWISFFQSLSESFSI